LELIILFGHSVAIAALFFVPIPQLSFVLLLVVLLCSAVYFVLREARLFLADAGIALRLEGERIVLFNRKGDEMVGKLLRSSLVMPQIVILNIALPDRFWRKNIVLMPDSMDADSFRQLRVALKWGITFSI
jgi:toxin CptA